MVSAANLASSSALCSASLRSASAFCTASFATLISWPAVRRSSGGSLPRLCS
ncbi:Uncharacterised protein [Vibrio cholerae]|nr:Uncharacterised protein [Vibrio cholerae]